MKDKDGIIFIRRFTVLFIIVMYILNNKEEINVIRIRRTTFGYISNL